MVKIKNGKDKFYVMRFLPQLKQNETKAKNRNKLSIPSWFYWFQTVLKLGTVCYGFSDKEESCKSEWAPKLSLNQKLSSWC